MRMVTTGLLVLVLGLEGCVPRYRVPEPDCQVILYEMYVWRDGGSLGFVIGCEGRKTIRFVVDGKIHSPTAGYFFLETIHTDGPRGTMLPLGGEEEQRLLGHLSSWLHATFTEGELKRISEIADFRKITRDELRAWHVQRLVNNRSEFVEELKRREAKRQMGE